ncbi:MAG: hypothetical protein GY850_35740 [bacterium]|nr:hypothetical protein [bacterium]
MKTLRIFFAVLFFLTLSGWTPEAFTAAPNIHLILDNSGSMNYNAYGTWPGNNGEVPEPYACAPVSGVMNISVASPHDDAEERTVEQNAWTSSSDLDLGGYYSAGTYYQTMVGIRFRNVLVPQGVTVRRAYIQFTGSRGGDHTGEATSLLIFGQDDGNPEQFVSVDDDVSSRPRTAVMVSWDNLPDWNHDQNDNATRTPDLTPVVQYLVNQADWSSGNAMAFIFERSGSSGKRDVYAGDTESVFRPVLHIEVDVDDTGEDCSVAYYGYFDPAGKYTYNTTGQYFERDPDGDWNGNWLNWCTMRRIDIMRKVLVGGRAETRDGSGATVVSGEIPVQTMRGFYRYLDGADFTSHAGFYYFGVRYGYLYVDDDPVPWSSSLASYALRVRKTAVDDPDDFMEGNVAGVLQRISAEVRWSSQWFYASSAGGIVNPIGADLDTLVASVETKGCETFTPLAESYYVTMQYFSQQHGAMHNENNWYPDGNFVASPASAADPYYSDGAPIQCARSFCLLLTDGASSNDLDIPEYLKNYDGDTHENDRMYENDGSDYLDDVALYARTTDLRPVAGDELDGEQNLLLYPVYAFGNDQNARNLLMDAAKNGGFIDKDGDNKPDTIDDPRGGYWSDLGNNVEWDSDGDMIPDNYFEALDGYALEAAITTAISDMLQRDDYDDTDGDGTCDEGDNCPGMCNAGQFDADSDGIGDVCDTEAGCGGCDQPECELTCALDTDGDGILDYMDNCLDICNVNQHDADGDGTGDVCDETPGCGGCEQPGCEQQC